MIAELAVAAALLGPAADPPPPMAPVEGVVMYMEHKPNTPAGPLGTPTGPECYLLNISTTWTRQNVCVPKEQYEGTHWMDYFRGDGYPAPKDLVAIVNDFLLP